MSCPCIPFHLYYKRTQSSFFSLCGNVFINKSCYDVEFGKVFTMKSHMAKNSF